MSHVKDTDFFNFILIPHLKVVVVHSMLWNTSLNWYKADVVVSQRKGPVKPHNPSPNYPDANRRLPK